MEAICPISTLSTISKWSTDPTRSQHWNKDQNFNAKVPTCRIQIQISQILTDGENGSSLHWVWAPPAGDLVVWVVRPRVTATDLMRRETTLNPLIHSPIEIRPVWFSIIYIFLMKFERVSLTHWSNWTQDPMSVKVTSYDFHVPIRLEMLHHWIKTTS